MACEKPCSRLGKTDSGLMGAPGTFAPSSCAPPARDADNIDVGQRVLGFTAIRGLLESIFGPLAVQPLSSQIYGLYTGFVYFTPFFGGLLADRVIGQRKAVILGAVLMAIGHFMMASERMFFP